MLTRLIKFNSQYNFIKVFHVQQPFITSNNNTNNNGVYAKSAIKLSYVECEKSQERISAASATRGMPIMKLPRAQQLGFLRDAPHRMHLRHDKDCQQRDSFCFPGRASFRSSARFFFANERLRTRKYAC